MLGEREVGFRLVIYKEITPTTFLQCLDVDVEVDAAPSPVVAIPTMTVTYGAK